MSNEISYSKAIQGITKHLKKESKSFRDCMIHISKQYYNYDISNLDTNQIQKLKNMMTCLLMYCHITINFSEYPKVIKNLVLTKEIISKITSNNLNAINYPDLPLSFIEQYNEFKEEIYDTFKENNELPELNLTFRANNFHLATSATFKKIIDGNL